MGLFWFAAALLGAALIFSGCETEAETETKYVAGEMIHLDVVAKSIGELEAALAETGDLAIGVYNTAGVTLTANLPIPGDKTVYILNGTTLSTTASANLTVKGIVYVGIGATLATTAGKVIVEEGGHVSVLSEKTVAGISVSPGTLKVATELSVNDGAEAPATAATVLGTDKVRIGGTLEFTALDSATAVTDAFGYVRDKGTVVGHSTSFTPSAIATTVTAPTGDRKLVMSTSATDNGTAPLTIPAWLDLTATGTGALNAITGLTVNGTLTASSATLAAVTTLTVNGTLTASTSNITALGDSTVAAGGVLTTAAVTVATDATLAATAGSTVNGILFPADATITALAANAVTIGDLTIPADATLTVAGGKTLNVAAGKKLILATASTTSVGKISGAGSIVAGATTITGAWEAVGATTTAGTLTILSAATGATITADGTNATGLKASTGGGTITQAAGSATNSLVISTNTTIALGGTDAAKLGAVVLTGASNPGKVTLTAATSIITTGATATGAGAYTNGVKQTKVATVTTLGDTVIVQGVSSHIVSVAGGGAGNGTIAAATDGDISIDSETSTTDAAS